MSSISSFSTRTEPDGLVISIDRAADLNDFRTNTFREALYEAVLALEVPRVALDMKNVDYLSSSGVAILVGLNRRIVAQNGKLVLFRVHPVVLDLLRVMRLHQYFAIADSEDDALGSLRPVPTA